VHVPVDPDYLLQARQTQKLSLALHLPLVCFGIAFQALLLFRDWWDLRTGDVLFRALARRWSKVMPALFAVGVVMGRTLSFEPGLLWPGSWRASAACSSSPVCVGSRLLASHA
jgi:cytochrome d ubiquinol oxidase subunit I